MPLPTTPGANLSVEQLILHDFGVAVNIAVGALHIVVDNDSFLPPQAQTVLAVLSAALTDAQAVIKAL